MQLALKRRRLKRRSVEKVGHRVAFREWIASYVRGALGRNLLRHERMLYYTHSNLNKKRVGPWQIDWPIGVIPILYVAGY